MFLFNPKTRYMGPNLTVKEGLSFYLSLIAIVTLCVLCRQSLFPLLLLSSGKKIGLKFDNFESSGCNVSKIEVYSAK